MENPEISPAEGRLGVLLPGMGAVATTTVAGVLLARKGLATPIGSLTQMNTIRLGQRTENRTPLIKDFIALTELDDIVFGGWDPIPDNAYESAVNAGVLSAKHLDPIRDELSAIAPMPAAFDTEYVTRLDGPNKKTGANKREIAESLREDIRKFKAENEWSGAVPRRYSCARDRPMKPWSPSKKPWRRMIPRSRRACFTPTPH